VTKNEGSNVLFENCQERQVLRNVRPSYGTEKGELEPLIKRGMIKSSYRCLHLFSGLNRDMLEATPREREEEEKIVQIKRYSAPCAYLASDKQNAQLANKGLINQAATARSEIYLCKDI
jgi:hypothetical protein